MIIRKTETETLEQYLNRLVELTAMGKLSASDAMDAYEIAYTDAPIFTPAQIERANGRTWDK